MGLVCKYGAKECNFCQRCYEGDREERKKTCYMCGKVLSDDNFGESLSFLSLCKSCCNAVRYGGI